MPKKTLGFCGTICTLCGTSPVYAATCAPGYYLENNTCLGCNQPAGLWYCPGDDTRHDCPTTNTDYTQFGYILVSVEEGIWANALSTSSAGCRGRLYLRDNNGSEFLMEPPFNGENYWSETQGRLWYKAGKGFYLSAYRGSSWKNWYYGTKPCTNAPAHAHYTGPGTPDEPRSGGATDYNDCPWECDDGYGRIGDTCEPLCATGITHIRAGTTTAPLFPVKYTTPSLVIRTASGVCYGNLTPGDGPGINITINGITYHLE